MPLEDAKAWLREMKGVGPKTAACVLMFALGRPALPVDTHVHRVSQRLGFVPEKATAEQAHDMLEAMLAPELVFPFHISLIKHGRRLCRAQRPLCAECPLLDGCPAGQEFVKSEASSYSGDFAGAGGCALGGALDSRLVVVRVVSARRRATPMPHSDARWRRLTACRCCPRGGPSGRPPMGVEPAKSSM